MKSEEKIKILKVLRHVVKHSKAKYPWLPAPMERKNEVKEMLSVLEKSIDEIMAKEYEQIVETRNETLSTD